jgi:hypothetical protein
MVMAELSRVCFFFFSRRLIMSGRHQVIILLTAMFIVSMLVLNLWASGEFLKSFQFRQERWITFAARWSSEIGC